MQKTLILSLLLASTPLWAAPVQVLSSFSILGNVTQELGGERVQVQTLIGPNQDAHTYQLQSQDVKKIQAAQLIVLNGLGFERADIRRATQNSGKKIVNATQGLPALPLPAHDHHHAGHNHDHGAYDPHVWHDPILMKAYAANITQALIATDPAGKTYYQARLAQYQSQLNQLHAWSQQQFNAVPASKRKALTAHHSFAYLGKRYHIQFYAPQGVNTHDSASATSVARLIKQVKQERIQAVLVENMVNPKLVQQIARETGSKTQGMLYADALSQQGAAKTYVSMVRHNVNTLVAAMK